MNFGIIYLICLLFSPPKTETILFDVILHGKTVGELKAVKTVSEDHVKYTNETNIETYIIIDVLVSYQFDVTFKDDQLHMSDAVITVNDKVHDQTSIEWTGDKYIVSKQKGHDKFIDHPIRYSSEMLIFHEPVGETRSFAELSGEFHELTEVKPHVYGKVDDRGHKNTYYYENGQLVKAEISAGMIGFELLRK